MHLRTDTWIFLPAQMLLCIAFCHSGAGAGAGAEAARYQGAALQRGIRFLYAHTTYNHAYVHNLTTNFTTDTLNIDMRLLKDIVQGFMTKFDVHINLSADKKRFQSIFTYTADICRIMNNLSHINLLHAWLLNVVKFSNMKTNCPLEANHYYIRNFVVEKGSIPAYLQAGNYRITTHHYYVRKKSKKEITVSNFIADFEIYER